LKSIGEQLTLTQPALPGRSRPVNPVTDHPVFRAATYLAALRLANYYARHPPRIRTIAPSGKPSNHRPGRGRHPRLLYTAGLVGPARVAGCRMGPITPKELLDVYELLSEENQRAFLRLLGGRLSGEALFAMLGCLHRSEYGVFIDSFHGLLAETLYPVYIREARRVAKESSNLSDEEFDRQVTARVQQATDQFKAEIGSEERDKLKAERNRQSNPETVRRNVEICDLRLQDPKRWTHGRLARKYGKTSQLIRKILKEETEWRRKAREQSTD
jgi:hypothetical protein